MGSERTDVEADEPLTSSGLIDSLGMLRLIAHLEEQYQMEVGDGDVGDENFGHLSRLAAFVDRRRAIPESGDGQQTAVSVCLVAPGRAGHPGSVQPSGPGSMD